MRDAQVTTIVGLPTSVISQTSLIYEQNVHFNDEFPGTRSMHGIQQAVLVHNDISQRSSLRESVHIHYQLGEMSKDS